MIYPTDQIDSETFQRALDVGHSDHYILGRAKDARDCLERGATDRMEVLSESRDPSDTLI